MATCVIHLILKKSQSTKEFMVRSNTDGTLSTLETAVEKLMITGLGAWLKW
jgi:hypothetical protein